jgi:hypothetical protein
MQDTDFIRKEQERLGIEETMEEAYGQERDRDIQLQLDRQRKQKTLSTIIGWK